MSIYSAPYGYKVSIEIVIEGDRQQLIDAWLDYVNNYPSIEKYAEHNGLTYSQALKFLEVALGGF